jgi:hypothetical protein
MIDFPASPTLGEQFSFGGTVWEWDGTKWTTVPGTSSGGPFLELAGGTMVGDLTLAADPLNPLDAATKEYVDTIQTGFLPLTGGTLIGNLTAPGLIINGAAGGARSLFGETAGSYRWIGVFGDNVAESGVNAGSNFQLQAYSDAAAYLSTPLAINRASGVVTIPSLAAPQAIGDNRIINGDMRIDQRNAGASGTAINAYTVDRWLYACSQANLITWGQGGPSSLAGFPYYWSLASNSAYVPLASDYCQLLQSIEADMISDFAWGTASAQPVTLSFWAVSSVTGTFSGALGGATNRYYPFTFSIPIANTWTRIAVTIPGDTAGAWTLSGNGTGLSVDFDLGSGANYRAPANAWTTAPGGIAGANGAVSVVATNGATFGVTGVKLEIGSVATPYNRQSLAKSMADCQRYYQVLGEGGGWDVIVQGYAAFVGQSIGSTVSFNTAMRATPTVTQVGTWTINGAPGASFSSGRRSLGISINSTIAGEIDYYNSSSGACITLDAEL